MRVGQARKRDSAEAGIVKALRALGATVVPVSGAGAPDLLVWHQGRWEAVEVKAPKGKLTKAQSALQRQAPFLVIRSVDEVLALFGARERR